jgi:hypothetical protein
MSLGLSFNTYNGYDESKGSDQSVSFIAGYYMGFEFVDLDFGLSHESLTLVESEQWEVSLSYISANILAAKKYKPFTFLAGVSVMYRLSEKLSIDSPYNKHINTGDLQLLYNIGVKYDLDNLLGYHILVGFNYKHPIFTELNKNNPSILPKSVLLFESLQFSLIYEFN